MSYARLENNCIPHTLALTSNSKFMDPASKVYDEIYTHTYMYPGSKSAFVKLPFKGKNTSPKKKNLNNKNTCLCNSGNKNIYEPEWKSELDKSLTPANVRKSRN